MNFLYRIILKINTTWKSIYKNAYIEICKARGMKVGEGVIFIEAPAFGSEPYLIEIGDRTKITAGCTFINHGGDARVTKRIEKYKDGRNFGRIKIGNNTFIGKGTILMPGISIGNNCIIGSLSVVNSSVPDNSVYAGTPVKFICTIDEYGERLLKNNVMYPRELEQNRKALEDYLQKNLPHTYKPVKQPTPLP